MANNARPYTTCQRTGFLVPYDETVVEWTGLRVWVNVVDPRHPQDFVKVSPRPKSLDGQNYDDDFTEDNNFNVFLQTDTGVYLTTDTGLNLQAD